MKTKYIKMSLSVYRLFLENDIRAFPNHYDIEVNKEGDCGRYLNVDYDTLLDKVMDFMVEAKEENERFRK